MSEVRFQNSLSDPSLIMKVQEAWGAQNPQHRELIYAALDQVLQGQKLYSSVSHSGPMGGFVVSQFPVGFDIEENSRLNDRLIARVSTEEELRQAPDNTSLWCAKEAAFKALRNFKQPQTVSQIEIEFLPNSTSSESSFHLCRVRNEKIFDASNSLGGTFSASGLTYCIIIFRP